MHANFELVVYYSEHFCTVAEFLFVGITMKAGLIGWPCGLVLTGRLHYFVTYSYKISQRLLLEYDCFTENMILLLFRYIYICVQHQCL